MTKDIEVGDEYTGEVVKLADFGAFVELRKGVDGLLHVSRILPKGNRLASAEQVLARGDKVRVTVVEVDKDRGRIGLTLLGKRPTTAARPARAAGGRRRGQPGPGALGERPPPRRWPRSRPGSPAASLADKPGVWPQPDPGRPASQGSGSSLTPLGRRQTARESRLASQQGQAEARPFLRAPAAADLPQKGYRPPATPLLQCAPVQRYTVTTLDGGERIVTERVRSVRSVSIGIWIGAGSRDESVDQAGISHFIEHLLFKGSSRYSGIRSPRCSTGSAAS